MAAAQAEGRQDESPALIAAVDLGSNSFHMIVARMRGDRFEVVDRLREAVRMGAGLEDTGELTPEAQARALECLARFGQRLSGFPSAKVRAVGTNALRRARNGRAFLVKARQVLGHPIDVISGVEEARLIHLGVASALPNVEQPHLVLDIGGGSTEVIVGKGLQSLAAESISVGCVSLTQRFFGDGSIRPRTFAKAVMEAELELEPIRQRFLDLAWTQAVGASGTMRAVERIAIASGWSEGGITLAALHKLRAALIDAGSIKALNLPELSKDRALVLPGGLAVLICLFETLKLDKLAVSERALREGLLCDMLGRIQHKDVREQSIDYLMTRYGVDKAQAARVKRTALSLWDAVKEPWRIADESVGQALAWACQLHEIGLAVAHDHYQRHGAYLIENSDLPGFTRQEQLLVAVVVQNHRRKVVPESFDVLRDEQQDIARSLSVLLRIAVLLHRSHTTQQELPMRASAEKRGLRLRFPPGWLAQHPLTLADLEREQDQVKAAKIDLVFE